MEQLQVSPRARLCLENPSLDRARLLAVAFSTYHALKLANRGLVDSSVASGDFYLVQIKLLYLADAYARELIGGPNLAFCEVRSGQNVVPEGTFGCPTRVLRRVPIQSGSSSSASAVPGVRAGPTLQSYGARSTFVAQADTTVPEAWGHQQSNFG